MGCKNSLRIAANNVRIQLFDVGVDDFLLLSISIGGCEREVKRSQEFFLVYSENILLIVFLLLAINVDSRADAARDVVSCNVLVALFNAFNIDDVFGCCIVAYLFLAVYCSFSIIISNSKF